MAKGFKHGAGGTSLNFKVIGNPMPETAKENTIWVNTDTKITGYVFSATQPTGLPGLVRFLTGSHSNVEFNALKKNGIQVYPISAKQYVDGAWVEKTAKSYQNGAFVDWWNGSILVDGKDYVNGFTIAENYGTVTIGAYITIARDVNADDPNGGDITYVNANNPIDIKPFNSLKFSVNVLRKENVNNGNHVTLTIGFKDSTGAWVCNKYLDFWNLNSGDYTISLETGGEYYFAIELYTYIHYGKANIQIYNVRVS